MNKELEELKEVCQRINKLNKIQHRRLKEYVERQQKHIDLNRELRDLKRRIEKIERILPGAVNRGQPEIKNEYDKLKGKEKKKQEEMDEIAREVKILREQLHNTGLEKRKLEDTIY